MGGGGGSSGSQDTVQAPWKPLGDQLQKLYGAAGTAYGNTPKTPYTGDFIAAPTADQLNALSMGRSAIAGLSPNLGSNAIDLGQRTLRGDFLDPNANPAFQSMLKASLDPVTKSYTESILPGIKSASISSGAYGGSREGLALGKAAGEYANAANNIAGQLGYNQYNQERSYQQNAPALISQGLGLQLAPSDLLSSIGATGRGFTQDAINNAAAQRQELQTAPWNGIQQYANALLGAQGGTTTTSSNTSPFANAITGGLGGAALGAGVGNLLGATGIGGYAPYIGGGAVLGALGGAFT